MRQAQSESVQFEDEEDRFFKSKGHRIAHALLHGEGRDQHRVLGINMSHYNANSTKSGKAVAGIVSRAIGHLGNSDLHPSDYAGALEELGHLAHQMTDDKRYLSLRDNIAGPDKMRVAVAAIHNTPSEKITVHQLIKKHPNEKWRRRINGRSIKFSTIYKNKRDPDYEEAMKDLVSKFGNRR